MKVLRHFPKSADAPSVLAIGNFDGVHIGHQAVFQQLVQRAKALDIIPSVMTFEPHPREFFAPDQAPVRLTSLREKLELFEESGIQMTHVCHFDASFAAMSAEDFMNSILHRSLAVRHVMVGDDFCFGAKRSGNLDTLISGGSALGFDVTAIAPVILDGERVSSTVIRDALASGRLSIAKMLLGRDYSISGHVIHGDKLGRELGYPTANVQMHHDRPPLMGIFAVRVTGLGSQDIPGVASLGIRPTVNDSGKPTLEVHLFDFTGDLYNRHLRVHFLLKIRDEEKFASLEDLKKQMAMDEQAARDYFRSIGRG